MRRRKRADDLQPEPDPTVGDAMAVDEIERLMAVLEIAHGAIRAALAEVTVGGKPPVGVLLSAEGVVRHAMESTEVDPDGYMRARGILRRAPAVAESEDSSTSKGPFGV